MNALSNFNFLKWHALYDIKTTRVTLKYCKFLWAFVKYPFSVNHIYGVSIIQKIL